MEIVRATKLNSKRVKKKKKNIANNKYNRMINWNKNVRCTLMYLLYAYECVSTEMYVYTYENRMYIIKKRKEISKVFWISKFTILFCDKITGNLIISVSTFIYLLILHFVFVHIFVHTRRYVPKYLIFLDERNSDNTRAHPVRTQIDPSVIQFSKGSKFFFVVFWKKVISQNNIR